MDVLHGPLDEDHCVGPLGLGVHALVSHDGGDVPEHLLQLRVPLLVRHLQLPFGQNLFYPRNPLMNILDLKSDELNLTNLSNFVKFDSCLKGWVRSEVQKTITKLIM